MNAHLRTALKDLEGAGAVGVPSSSVIETAEDNTTWSGKNKTGDAWSLTKNSADSFNCFCGK